MKTIVLTKGKVALVDDGDYEELNRYSWYTQESSRTCYAVRTIQSPMVNGRRTKTMVYMHQQVLGLKRVDHKNHDGLDNRRENLRAASPAQNMHNKSSHKNSSSKFLGVSWHSRNSIWRARIMVNGVALYLGCYEDEIDAAKAYDKAASEYFGEYANLNFPTTRPQNNRE